MGELGARAIPSVRHLVNLERDAVIPSSRRVPLPSRANSQCSTQNMPSNPTQGADSPTWNPLISSVSWGPHLAGEEEIVDMAYELGLGIASTLKPGDKDALGPVLDIETLFKTLLDAEAESEAPVLGFMQG